MNDRQRCKRKIHTNRVGALSVEMALCLPILLTVLFGAYEVAHANMILHSTESAAYEGARTGITPGATASKIEASVKDLLAAVGIANFTVDVTPKVLDEQTESVTVVVSVPIRKNMSFPPFFFKDPTFRGSCKLSREIAR